MNLGVRAKFLLITLLIVVSVDLAAGVYLQWKLRATQEQRIEEELYRHARTARELLAFDLAKSQSPVEWTIAQVDPITDRLGESMAARLTVIGPGGKVLGDSSLGPAEIEALERHDDRPEVVAAQADACTFERRYSETLDMSMLYCALPLQIEGERQATYVRISTSLDDVAGSFAQIRTILVIGGLLSLLLALAAGLVAARVVSGKFRELVEAARAMAEGGENQRLPIRSTDEFGGIAGSLNRVSEELARTVKQLARERDLFETVIHSMDEAVIATDADRRVIAVNRSARELLDMNGEVDGRLLLEAVRLPQLSEVLEHALRGESRTTNIELERGGSLRHLLARGTPQGESGGAVLVMHDLTEIRRLETVRRDFVANVSHELRTPVSVIQANTETLLAGALEEPAQARRFLDAVRRNAERLGQLITDLLDISRIEAGKYKIELRSLSMSSVARAVNKSVAEACRRRGVTLEVEVPAELRVHSDSGALEQVLVNLIENAVKYGPEGGIVELVALEQGAAVRIEIRDEGPGIAPEHRRRVFERFYRVDPGRSRHMGGTGLGLAIVKNLTEAMGGDVGVDPREPNGSVFWLRLGRASAEGAQLELGEILRIDDVGDAASEDALRSAQ